MEEAAKTFGVVIRNRQTVELDGVIKLDSFNHTDFLVNTELGFVHVKGDNLSLGVMDTALGTLSIQGNIDSVAYVGKGKEQNKESFLKKLFK